MPKVIMLTGGGTAGHITPVLALAKKIHTLQPQVRLVYVIERNNPSEHLIIGSGLPIKVHHIFAGKYRRFHNQSFLSRLFSFKNNLLNLRDLVYVVIGLFQSLGLMLRYRPAVLFSKGGYVSLPVALSAVILRRRFVTHDSDSVPGISNRLTGRHAAKNAVGSSSANYPYEAGKTVFTGVPVSEEYHKRSNASSKDAKVDIGLRADSQVLLVGGSTQGAKLIDDAVEEIVPGLLKKFPKLFVIHSFGKLNEESLKTRYQKIDETLRSRLILKTFLPDLYRYAAAADIVITRAGATALAELGVLRKACIVIPARHLVDGHQVENALNLEKKSAIIVVNEERVGEELADRIEYLLQHKAERAALGRRLNEVTPCDAADRLAELIISESKRV